MKAQAKKILALIMAMVMCLSLAAPAFATYNSTGANAGTWTYVAGSDAQFTEVAVDAAGKKLSAIDPTKAKYADIEVTYTSGDKKTVRFYDSDGTGSTYVDAKGIVISDTDEIAAITAYTGTWTAVPVKYESKRDHITRITGDNESATYTAYGFKTGQLYTADANGDIPDAPYSSASVTATKQPNYITVTDQAAVSLIGQPQTAAKYTVTAKAATGVTVETTATATVTVGESNPAKKSFDDVKDSWTAMSKEQTFTPDGGTTYYQVDGSIYQEPQGNGLVKAYFKLYPVSDDGTGFDETKDPVYLVNPNAHATYAESQYGEALAGAVLCDNIGTETTTGILTATDKNSKKVVLTIEKNAKTETVYGFTAWNASKDLEINDMSAATVNGYGKGSTNGSVTVTFDSASELTTATFDVKILATTMSETSGVKDTTAYVTNVDEATKLLKKAGVGIFNGCTLTSVAAASGDTLTVTVTKSDATKYQTKVTSDTVYAKNVWFNGTTGDALLIDVEKEGWFNATSAQGGNAKSIEAGKKALGPVLVKQNQVNDTKKYAVSGTSMTDPNGIYYVFASVEDMQEGIKALKCTDGKDIKYLQVTLNPYKGSKKNGLVTELKKKVVVTESSENTNKSLVDDALAQAMTGTSSTGYVVNSNLKKDSITYAYDGQATGEAPAGIELTKTWIADATATSNADFVVEGTWTVAAAEHGTKVKVKKTTARTCQVAGSEYEETICTDCNKVLETSTPKEVPADTNTLEFNPDGNKEKPETLAFGEGNKTTDTPGHKTSHWAEKAVTTTTVSEDKSETVTTTVIYCNYGVAHDKFETRVSKTSLQNSGRFNHFSADGRKTDKVLNVDKLDNMFGYEDGVSIADSDVDNEALVLNRKATSIPKDNRTALATAATFGQNVGDDLMIKFPSDTFERGTGGTFNNQNTYNITKNADDSYTAFEAVTLNDVYATATAKPVTKYYVATLTAKVTKDPYYKCQTGLATMTANVYEVTKSTDTKGFKGLSDGSWPVIAAVSNEENLEKNLKSGKVTLLQTYSMDNIVIRASSYHNYDTKTGICTTCLQGVQAVEEAMFTADTVTVENLTWTGKKVQPKVTVFDTKQNYLLKGVDYVVEEIDDTDAGEYTITIKGLEDYSGNRVTVPFTINKVAATLKKKSAPKTLTANKNKAVTGQIKMTVKGGKVAKYKVTGKVAGVSVNKKGKITVKKGNKKAGTLKVKVSMKADKNHTAAKAVTVKVAIKAAKK